MHEILDIIRITQCLTQSCVCVTLTWRGLWWNVVLQPKSLVFFFNHFSTLCQSRVLHLIKPQQPVNSTVIYLSWLLLKFLITILGPVQFFIFFPPISVELKTCWKLNLGTGTVRAVPCYYHDITLIYLSFHWLYVRTRHRHIYCHSLIRGLQPTGPPTGSGAWLTWQQATRQK